MSEQAAPLEYFAVMTVQGIVDGYARAQTITATGVFGTATRAEIYAWMQGQFAPELSTLPVVFFSVEPNRIGSAE